MVVQVRRLFANLILTNQKYVDPTPVLQSVVDDYGNKIDVGAQQDITEYLLNFLDRLQEGMLEVKMDGSVNDVSLVNILDAESIDMSS